MSSEEILEKLNLIFSSVLADPALKLSLSTQQSDIKDWDSLNQVNIVVQVEKEFKIKFKLSEVKRLTDVRSFVNLIQEKKADAV